MPLRQMGPEGLPQIAPRRNAMQEDDGVAMALINIADKAIPQFADLLKFLKVSPTHLLSSSFI